MSRRRMTENEKVVFFCLLFPPLWIFLPVLAVSAICTKIKEWWDGRKG